MASPVFLFSPPVVQKVECVNLKWAAAQNGKFDRFEGVLRTISNVTWSQQVCNDELNRFCYYTVSSFSFSYCNKAKCWKHAVRRISPRVICHEVPPPIKVFFQRLNFFYGNHFTIGGRQKATFWKKWAWSAVWRIWTYFQFRTLSI